MKATIQLQLDQFTEEDAKLTELLNEKIRMQHNFNNQVNEELNELQRQILINKGKIELLTDMKDGN